jgi:glycerophosphoryl diester phosphodiesterase
MHIIDQLPAPIIFAHRGASKYAPENTMAAFETAFRMGAPAIELDTMLTRDGVPVVIHDRTLERTTNGSGRVDERYIDELLQLDAGSHFSGEFKGERIPELKDVFIRFKSRLLINVELKNYHAPLDDLPVCVAEMVREMDILDSIIFSSFLPNNLLRIKRILPDAKVALLVEKGFISRLLSSRLCSFISPQFIHPYRSSIRPVYLKKEHDHARRVNVWTVNDLEEAKTFMKWGVDGLITDDPRGLLDLLI